MPMLICDPDVIAELETEREANGLDRYDEVWEGVHVVMPLPTVEHQEIVTLLCTILRITLGISGSDYVLAGVNVSDRVDGWKQNYREPDVAVYLDGNPATNCGSHWCGGPDFLAEIISPGDPVRDKLPFYGSVKTGEALIVDRAPWQLELYRLQNGTMIEVGRSNLAQPDVLASSVLPLTFRLVAGASRPQIEVSHSSSGQTWRI